MFRWCLHSFPISQSSVCVCGIFSINELGKAKNKTKNNEPRGVTIPLAIPRMAGSRLFNI